MFVCSLNIANLEYIFRTVLCLVLFVLVSLDSIRTIQLYVDFHPEGSFQIIYNISPAYGGEGSTATGLYF